MLGEYKTEAARVRSIESRGAWVETVCGNPSEQGCETCGTGGCGSAGTKSRGPARVFVRTEPSVRFSEGQMVTVRRFVPNEALAAGIVFGIPLLCAVLALMVIYHVAPAKAESAFGALTALVCLVGGFGVVAAAERVWERAHPATLVEDRTG